MRGNRVTIILHTLVALFSKVFLKTVTRGELQEIPSTETETAREPTEPEGVTGVFHGCLCTHLFELRLSRGRLEHGARCKVQGGCQQNHVEGARCKLQGARCKVQGARCEVPGARYKVVAALLMPGKQGLFSCISLY